MKILSAALLLLLATSLSYRASAQTPPACPVILPSNFSTLTVPLRPPLTTEATGFLNFGQFSVGYFQFVAENVVISGNQLSFVARSEVRFGSGQLLYPSSVGLLPAGVITATVTSIWTAVTPNIVCPPQVVTFNVQQGAVNVPVPSYNGFGLVLLGCLLAIFSVARLRKRA